MKKFFALLLALVMLLTFAACTPSNTDESTDGSSTPESTGDSTPESTGTTDPEFDPAAKSEGVMTYAEYAAAEVQSEVTIEAYVQAKQGWWEQDGQGRATLYLQDPDGGYLVYNLFCTEAEYEQMTVGTKLKIHGYKAEFSGEYEIDGADDATFEIMEGTWVSEPMDATSLLASEDLINHQNKKVSFTGMTVEAANDNGDAFLYKWNGSGSAGDDLYFNVSVNGQTYTFCVESYLCGDGTEVYEAVEALKVGDVIDLEGFLYWYNGAQPHITSVTASK